MSYRSEEYNISYTQKRITNRLRSSPFPLPLWRPGGASHLSNTLIYMSELKNGTRVQLTNGKSCTVKKELGRGGQGIVYLVDYEGKDYALKWYIVDYPDAFMNNLEKNCKAGAPTKNFLWPIAVARRQYDSFGYVMQLRPQGYEEMAMYILAKARFASLDAMFNACLQICTGFMELHKRGLCYQDMNDGNFFINPRTGDVLVCDNDNVAPNGVDVGILGKSGYMAPEIVERESAPNRHTDYFSQAVCLFILIYLNKPFEGARYLSCPCLSPEAERKLFGKGAVFICDPTDNSNRPVKGIHNNVINRWPLFPKYLQKAFVAAFSKEAICTPGKRLLDKKWQEVIIQLRSLYIKCPQCGEHTFYDPTTADNRCLECGRTVPAVTSLFVGHYAIPLAEGQKIYCCQVKNEPDYDKVAATVVKNAAGKLGLKNQSDMPWTVMLPTGEVRVVKPGEGMPAAKGLKIRFGQNETGGIK